MAKKQTESDLFHIAAERSIDDLGRKLGIVIQKDSKKLGLFPVEFLTPELLKDWRKKRGDFSILITSARAKAVGLKTKTAMLISTKDLPFDAIMALADPTHELLRTWRGLAMRAKPAGKMESYLTLPKQAALLPALIVFKGPFPKHWMTISEKTLTHYLHNPKIEAVQSASARLPLKGAENTRIASFRSRFCNTVHLALIIGNIGKIKAPLVRVHSSCVTGDILGSLRCDCGDQLQLALKQITQEGAGIFIYLHQEGRGIGITNKLRAYKLQEQGFDTFTANRLLGFEEDERDFAIADAILSALGVTRIRLLTNNPGKIDALKKHGIKIEKRVPVVIKSGKHNVAYLTAKSRAGHQF